MPPKTPPKQPAVKTKLTVTPKGATVSKPATRSTKPLLVVDVTDMGSIHSTHSQQSIHSDDDQFEDVDSVTNFGEVDQDPPNDDDTERVRADPDSTLVDLFPAISAEEIEVISDEEPSTGGVPNPTPAQVKDLQDRILIRDLKRERTQIYRSITRMSKVLRSDKTIHPLTDWTLIHEKSMSMRNRLVQITRELSVHNKNTKRDEIERARKYLNLLNQGIASLTTYIQELDLELIDVQNFYLLPSSHHVQLLGY